MPIYMKFDGIDGDVTDKGHEKWIEVLSFSWGVTNSGAHAGGGGGGAGKVNMQDFHFVHRVDKASPKLMLTACSGKPIQSAVMAFTEESPTPTPTDGTIGREQRKGDYLIIKLRDILVSGVRPGADNEKDENALEAVSLNFSKMHVEYTAPDGEVVSGSAG